MRCTGTPENKRRCLNEAEVAVHDPTGLEPTWAWCAACRKVDWLWIQNCLGRGFIKAEGDEVLVLELMER